MVAPCTTSSWILLAVVLIVGWLCDVLQRAKSSDFDPNLLDRPCCGNRDLDGPKVCVPLAGVSGLASTHGLAGLFGHSGVPNNSINCHRQVGD